MSRFEREGSPSALPERLRDGGGSELEQRVLNAAARELPSRELLERMALAVGVAAPPSTPVDPSTPDLGAAASRGAFGLRTLLPWISAGVVVAAAGAFVATRPNAASPSPVRPAGVVASAPSGVALPSVSAVSEPVPPVVEATPNLPPAPVPRARGGPSVADIQDQIALIDAARTALSKGSSERALELLRQYQGKYPSGSFRPEAQALKIEALAKLGRDSEARALGDRFIDEHRGSPLADRVSRALGKARQ